MKKKYFSVVIAFCIMIIFSFPAYASSPSFPVAFSFPSFHDLGDFFVSLFVPGEDYFNDNLRSLNDLINSRFGGLGELYQIINNFFSIFQSSRPAEITFSLPSNYFFPGYRGFSYNVFALAAPYISFVRNVLNSSCILFTAIACYHKLRVFFSE